MKECKKRYAQRCTTSLLSKPTPFKEEGLGFRKVKHGGSLMKKWWEKFKEYMQSEAFLHFFDAPHFYAERALQRIEIYRGEANE